MCLGRLHGCNTVAVSSKWDAEARDILPHTDQSSHFVPTG